MSVNFDAISDFIELCQQKYPDDPIFIFGFTFMIWQYFVKVLEQQNKNLDLSQVIVLHSGGWKKLQQQAVSNSEFKARLQRVVSKNKSQCKIHNFYGMVEQTGTVYVECESGFLHAPVWSDIEVKSFENINKNAQIKTQGVIQLSSLLPTSYPGHIILTEDIGTLHGIDNCSCGRNGKYFTVEGRLAKAETRGCSDTQS